VKRRVFARVGSEDVLYVKRLNRLSRVMEVVGRILIHFSPEPITFALGVGALWIHKQLQASGDSGNVRARSYPSPQRA